MWKYKYNNDANGYFHEWFSIEDIDGNVIAKTPNATTDDETNARLISSLSHFSSILSILEENCDNDTKFIDWLKKHPCDWALVTMVYTSSVFCLKCGNSIGNATFGINLVASLELCRELAICKDCEGE